MTLMTPTDDGAIRRGRTAPFTQTPEWVIAAPITVQAKGLYVALSAHENHARGDGRVWPGLTAVAHMLGFADRRSLSRYVKELTDLGAIDVHREITASGWRQVYTVHEIPSQGYAGVLTIAEWHKQHREQEATKPEPNPSPKGSKPSAMPSTMPLGEPSAMPSTSGGWTVHDDGSCPEDVHDDGSCQGGSLSTGSDGSQPVDSGGSLPTDSDNQTKVNQKKSNQKEGLSEGHSRGGLPASRAGAKSARTRRDLAVLRGDDLVGLTSKALTKKCVAVWTSVLREHDGLEPFADTGGWEPDGLPRSRGEHPLGGQLKRILEDTHEDHLHDPEWLTYVLKQVRDHARTYAETHPAAA